MKNLEEGIRTDVGSAPVTGSGLGVLTFPQTLLVPPGMIAKEAEVVVTVNADGTPAGDPIMVSQVINRLVIEMTASKMKGSFDQNTIVGACLASGLIKQEFPFKVEDTAMLTDPEIDDDGVDHTGRYTIALNIPAGPVKFGLDTVGLGALFAAWGSTGVNVAVGYKLHCVEVGAIKSEQPYLMSAYNMAAVPQYDMDDVDSVVLVSDDSMSALSGFTISGGPTGLTPWEISENEIVTTARLDAGLGLFAQQYAYGESHNIKVSASEPVSLIAVVLREAVDVNYAAVEGTPRALTLGEMIGQKLGQQNRGGVRPEPAPKTRK